MDFFKIVRKRTQNIEIATKCNCLNSLVFLHTIFWQPRYSAQRGGDQVSITWMNHVKLNLTELTTRSDCVCGSVLLECSPLGVCVFCVLL